MSNEFELEQEDSGQAGTVLAIDPKLILVKLIRYWPVLIVFTGLAVLIVFFYHRYTDKQYQVSEIIVIQIFF